MSVPHSTHVAIQGSGTSSVLQFDFLCSLKINKNMLIASERTVSGLYSGEEFPSG